MATVYWSRILFILVFAIIVILVWTIATLRVVTTNTQTSSKKWESDTLVERNKYMYNNSFTSDIKFTFGNNLSGEIFYAHKYVLAISSPVFYEIFYSLSRKNITDIYLPHSDNETVADFFAFLYEEKCPTTRNIEKGLQVLQLVLQYQIASFHISCKNYLEPTAQDAFRFLEQFLEMKAERYIHISLGHIDTLANEYFTSEYFLDIKLDTLDALLQRDTLDCSEVTLFKAVLNWVDHQCLQQNLEASYENRRKILGNVIYNIRFLTMTLNEFTTDVIAVDILSDHESIGIIKGIVGHRVPDLLWDNPNQRRHRKPYLLSWRAYGRIIAILCGLIGFWFVHSKSRREQSGVKYSVVHVEREEKKEGNDTLVCRSRMRRKGKSRVKKEYAFSSPI